MSKQRPSNDFPLHSLSHERNENTAISATVTREEPSSTMNHENENNYKYEPNFKHESSPSDSYDENGNYKHRFVFIQF